MSRQLGITIDFSNPLLENTQWGMFPPGIKIEKGLPLFPKIEVAPKSQDQEPTEKPIPQETTVEIGIEDFSKIELKTGRIVTAEAVPKSKKLLKLEVDIGTETRQIVSGIAMRYPPDTIIGKLVVIVANLKPVKLMGIESQGMVLAAGDKEVEGLLSITEDVNPGTKVK